MSTKKKSSYRKSNPTSISHKSRTGRTATIKNGDESRYALRDQSKQIFNDSRKKQHLSGTKNKSIYEKQPSQSGTKQLKRSGGNSKSKSRQSGRQLAAIFTTPTQAMIRQKCVDGRRECAEQEQWESRQEYRGGDPAEADWNTAIDNLDETYDAWVEAKEQAPTSTNTKRLKKILDTQTEVELARIEPDWADLTDFHKRQLVNRLQQDLEDAQDQQPSEDIIDIMGGDVKEEDEIRLIESLKKTHRDWVEADESGLLSAGGIASIKQKYDQKVAAELAKIEPDWKDLSEDIRTYRVGLIQNKVANALKAPVAAATGPQSPLPSPTIAPDNIKDIVQKYRSNKIATMIKEGVKNPQISNEELMGVQRRLEQLVRKKPGEAQPPKILSSIRQLPYRNSVWDFPPELQELLPATQLETARGLQYINKLLEFENRKKLIVGLMADIQLRERNFYNIYDVNWKENKKKGMVQADHQEWGATTLIGNPAGTRTPLHYIAPALKYWCKRSGNWPDSPCDYLEVLRLANNFSWLRYQHEAKLEDRAEKQRQKRALDNAVALAKIAERRALAAQIAFQGRAEENKTKDDLAVQILKDVEEKEAQLRQQMNAAAARASDSEPVVLTSEAEQKMDEVAQAQSELEGFENWQIPRPAWLFDIQCQWNSWEQISVRQLRRFFSRPSKI